MLILCLTKAIRLQPDNARAYASRADSRNSLKDYQGTIEDYQKAADLYLEQGNYEGLSECNRSSEDAAPEAPLVLKQRIQNTSNLDSASVL
jgi:tetratricopeptide (TPR) repeat protein